MKILPLILAALPAAISFSISAAPTSFEQAKAELRQKVYFDRNASGDTYCGCPWQWVGRSGGRVNLGACGYEVRAQPIRAQRIEWEHITPAWVIGHQRQCWQSGGRKNCVATDPVFRVMEADAHNITPVVGEVNGDRSNFRLTQLNSTPYQYGACRTRVDFKQRAAEPRDEAKGFVARVQFYMHDWYGLNMSRQQQQIFSAWDRQYPVSTWELERDRRIARIMGHSNPYVTGERTWSIGQRPSADGLRAISAQQKSSPSAMQRIAKADQSPSQGMVIGNRNSGVFHLPTGCPSYSKVSPANRVPFGSAQEAEAAGFRLAGNCR
jgi:deoxyribonuclease-1